MIVSFLGGLALFLYGQFILEKTLQRTSRIYLRGIIRLLTKHRITAILAGGILAVGMQSSTVPVFTLISLINRGVLQLGQAVGIIIGATIGTTVTIQVISFNITGYALWLIVIGFIIARFIKYARGEVLIGLGFMFYGINFIANGVALFKATSFGASFLTGLYASPVQNMAGAFILTLISQSTLAALAVGIVLIRDGGLGIANAVPIILGAHLGAGILPLIYSWRISESTASRQLGIANLLYRVIGVLMFVPLMMVWADISKLTGGWFGAGTARQLANAHTIFVLATAVIFYPFVMPFAGLIKKMFPENKKKSIKKTITLQENLDKIKELQAKMVDGVYQMLEESLILWEEDDIKEVNEIEKQGIMLRKLQNNIWKDVEYERILSGEEESKTFLKTINILGDIADIIDSKMTDIARTRIIQGTDFSIEGLNEVLSIHKRIIAEFNLLSKTLKGEKNISGWDKYKAEVNSLIADSFKTHISRINKGFHESKETRLLHTDAITLLEYIHWHIEKIMNCE